MDIIVKIEAPALVDAINALAAAVAGNIELILEGPGSRTEAQAVTTTQTIPVTQAETTTAHVASTPPPAVPVTQQTIPPAEQPGTIGVPTTTQTYSLEQLSVAATQLMEAGHRTTLINLLASFGVQALTELPKEQYGNFATQLRTMGARI